MTSPINTSWRATRLLFSLALGATIGYGPAWGQQSLANMLEPTRFALVIGNAAYGEQGNLPSLGSTCSHDKTVETDVKVVSDALIDAKWAVDTACDLTTDELKKKISDFNDRVIREPRAFGIVYFSGHGAQVAGTNYLFGVNAEIHERSELATFKQNPNALLFGGSAVPLDDAMRQIQPLWGKAVAVFVDACRTNPLIDKFRAEGLDLIRYPFASSAPINILFAFSTLAGEPSPDGGMGKVSRYARVLAGAIRAQNSAQQDELDLLVSGIGTQVIRDSHRTQFTGRAGIIQRPPKFCIRGCPSLAEEWNSYYEEFGPRRSSSSAEIPQQTAASTGEADTLAKPRAKLWRVSGTSMLMAQNHAWPDVIPAIRPSAPAALPAASDVLPVTQVLSEASPAAVTRKVRFDVLYCAGDTATEKREAKSEVIRDHLKQLTAANSPVAGFEVGEVRLVAVPPAVNQTLYKANDSVLTYNRDSPAQRDWAMSLQSILSPQLRIEEKPGVAPDYMTILVCDGAVPTEAGPTIYLQAATKEQVGKASELGADLALRLPNARVAKGIEVVEKSPNQTEIRYFSRAEAEAAAQIASATEKVLNRAVKARFVPGYDKKLNGARLVEVWIGKSEKP